jgi:plasmid stability protein
VANLVVRNLDRAVVEELKKRAGRHGRSAEAEHRAILETALRRTRRRTFAETLAVMPNVGRDEDFTRLDDTAAKDVFA